MDYIGAAAFRSGGDGLCADVCGDYTGAASGQAERRIILTVGINLQNILFLILF